jgi:arylsulfatase A-like enzyme
MGNRVALDGKWKLVSRYPDKWELYDVEADRTEMNDLASAMPEKADQLLKDYNVWAQRCGVGPWQQVRSKLRSEE